MVARMYTLAYVHTPATPATPPQRVCAAAAASGQRDAAVRFWLTSGSGDFHWLPEHPSEGVGVGVFYCAVFSADGMEMPDASRVRDASGVATLPAHSMWPQRTPLLRVSTDGAPPPPPTHPLVSLRGTGHPRIHRERRGALEAAAARQHEEQQLHAQLHDGHGEPRARRLVRHRRGRVR